MRDKSVGRSANTEKSLIKNKTLINIKESKDSKALSKTKSTLNIKKETQSKLTKSITKPEPASGKGTIKKQNSIKSKEEPKTMKRNPTAKGLIKESKII